MKIELITSEEIDKDGPKKWFIVIIDGTRKHFLDGDRARLFYDQIVEFHKKHGKTTPVETILKSEEI